MPQQVRFQYEQVLAETDGAILFEVEDGLEVWVPRSQIGEWDVEEHTVEIPRWLAEDKEIECVDE